MKNNNEQCQLSVEPDRISGCPLSAPSVTCTLRRRTHNICGSSTHIEHMKKRDAINSTGPDHLQDSSENERMCLDDHRFDCAKLATSYTDCKKPNSVRCSKVPASGDLRITHNDHTQNVRTSIDSAALTSDASATSSSRKRVLCEANTEDEAMATDYGEMRTKSISSTDSGSDLSRGSSDTGSGSFSSECSSNDNMMIHFNGSLGNRLPSIHPSAQPTSRFLKSNSFAYPTENVEGGDENEHHDSSIYQIKGHSDGMVDDHRVPGTTQANYLISRGMTESSDRCCVTASTMDNCYSAFRAQSTLATIEFEDCNNENAIVKCRPTGSSTNDVYSRSCPCSKSMLACAVPVSACRSSTQQDEPVSVKSERQMVCQQQCEASFQLDRENAQLALQMIPRDGSDRESNLISVECRRDCNADEQHGECHCSPMRPRSRLPLLTAMNQRSREHNNLSNNSGFTQTPPGSPSHSTFDLANTISPTSDPNKEALRTIYPMLSMTSNGLNDRFLIPAHLSGGDESKSALLNSRPSPPSPACSQYPSGGPQVCTTSANPLSHGQELSAPNQFSGNNASPDKCGGHCSSHSAHSSTIATVNAAINASKCGSSLICNADGQLVVPAAFGELHGYKIQNTSNGSGLLLSVANSTIANTTLTVHAQPTGHSGSSLAKHSVQRPASFALGSVSPTTPQDAARKRELRLQKNREAARECRRKKKEYIKCLENRVTVLESENKTLHDDLRHFRELYCQSAGGSGVHKTQHVQRISPAVTTTLTSRPGSVLPSAGAAAVCHPSTGAQLSGGVATGGHLFMGGHTANHQLPQLHHKVLSASGPNDPRPCVTVCRKGPCTITMTEKQEI